MKNGQRWQLSRYPSPNFKVIAKSDNTSNEWGFYVKEITDAACSHGGQESKIHSNLVR